MLDPELFKPSCPSFGSWIAQTVLSIVESTALLGGLGMGGACCQALFPDWVPAADSTINTQFEEGCLCSQFSVLFVLTTSETLEGEQAVWASCVFRTVVAMAIQISAWTWTSSVLLIVESILIYARLRMSVTTLLQFLTSIRLVVLNW